MALQGASIRFLSTICVLAAVCATAPATAAQSWLDSLTGGETKPKPGASTPAPVPAAQKTRIRAKTPAPAVEQRHKTNDNVLVIMGSGYMTPFTRVAEDITSLAEGIPQKQMRVISMIGKSSEQNLRDMVSLKNADIAVVDVDALDLLKTKDPKVHANIVKNVKYITKLFPIEMHVYAGPEIKSLEDLRGKTVSCQASTAASMCEQLFKTLNIDVQLVYEEETAAHQKLKKGEVAAVALGGTPPLASLEKVGPEENLHLVPVSEEGLLNADIASLTQRYQRAKLRHQDYPGLIPPGEYVPTIATEAALVVSAWPVNTPRYKLTQSLVNILLDRIDTLRVEPHHPRWREVNVGADLPGLTRFRPVQDWLDSKRNATGGNIMTSVVVDEDTKVKAAFDKFMEDYAKATGKSVDEKQKDELYPRFIEWWHKKNSKP